MDTGQDVVQKHYRGPDSAYLYFGNFGIYQWLSLIFYFQPYYGDLTSHQKTYYDIYDPRLPYALILRAQKYWVPSRRLSYPTGNLSRIFHGKETDNVTRTKDNDFLASIIILIGLPRQSLFLHLLFPNNALKFCCSELLAATDLAQQRV
jgi:hypothetical protein